MTLEGSPLAVMIVRFQREALLTNASQLSRVVTACDVAMEE